MDDINLLIRTADRSRKAEITVSPLQTAGDIVQAAVSNWSLPTDTEYTVVNVSKNPPQTLAPAETLNKLGVAGGETLEVQPVLVAGGCLGR